VPAGTPATIAIAMSSRFDRAREPICGEEAAVRDDRVVGLDADAAVTDALAEEVAAWLPWAERVVVKVASGGSAAASVHPSVAADRVRAGAERAVRAASAGSLETLIVPPPVVIEVDYRRGVEADHAAIVPGVERVGDRGIRIVSDDPIVAYRGFLAANRLASAVEQ